MHVRHVEIKPGGEAIGTLRQVEEEVLGKAYDGRLMRRLLGYLWPYRALILGALGCLIAHSSLQIAGPLLTKIAVDRFLVPTGAAAATPIDPWLSADPATGLMQIAFAYLAALAGIFLFEFGQTTIMQTAGQKAMFDLRRELMTHLQRLDIAEYDRNPVGRLVTRITTDVDALNDLFTSGLVTVLGDLLTLSFILAVMLSLSPGLTAIILGVFPFIILVTVLFRRASQSSYRRIRVAVAKINSYLQEHVTGIAVLQLFNREARASEQFAVINAEHNNAYKGAIQAYGWFYPAVDFFSTVAIASVLLYGGWRVESTAMTAGVVIAFLQYGLRFFRPVQDLSEKYNILQSAMAAAERVFKLLDTPVEIAAPSGARDVPAEASIEFDHVWFAYKGEDWVLRDLTFRIEPGETIAIVGHTGAGKTTIISLLLRFYDVQRGAIRIGGADVRELDPRQLRRRFGVVLQDPHLVSGTIEDNIRLGSTHITDEHIEAAAETVNLAEFIRSLPDGYKQAVRERGASLSTGQKQLISFARALAHAPRFLILDEATSSVDTETEMKIRDALARMVEGRTSILIAHRLSTVQRADRILVMHKGQLRESGSHQELLLQRDIYWKLYRLQYQEQESAGPRFVETDTITELERG